MRNRKARRQQFQRFTEVICKLEEICEENHHNYLDFLVFLAEEHQFFIEEDDLDSGLARLKGLLEYVKTGKPYTPAKPKSKSPLQYVQVNIKELKGVSLASKANNKKLKDIV